MGGYKVTETTEQAIVDIYWSLKKKYGKRPTAQKLLDTVNENIKLKKINNIYPPGLRKVGYIIADTEERHKHLPQEQQLQQESWSMLSLEKFPLPSGSIPYVLQMWRYSLSLHENLTVRQAKWASRLYSTIEDIPLLWIISLDYSHEEYISMISGQKFDTQKPDQHYLIEETFYKTLMTTHPINDPFELREGIFLYPPRAKDGGIVEELLHAIPYKSIYDFNNESEPEILIRQSESVHLVLQLPSTSQQFPDFDDKLVYLRYLSYLSEGPKWQYLTPDTILDIILQLREWVSGNISNLGNGPKHLYELVGYTVKEDKS